MPYGVPELNLHRFPASDARVDKLDVTVTLGVIHGTNIDMAEFVQAVPRDFPDSEGQVCRLLNRPRQPRDRNKWTWDIAKRVSADERRPLIGGKITCTRMTADRAGAFIPDGQWLLACNLYLNPTRWLRYQPIILNADGTHSLDITMVDLFSRDAEHSAERVLVDDTDNVVLGSNERMDLANPENWPGQLRRYLASVLNLLDSRVLHVAETQTARVIDRASRRFVLNTVETYWEQSCGAPVELLHQWEPATRRYASQSNTSYRRPTRNSNSPAPRIDDLLLGRDGNSPCYSMPVARGVEFKVYSKTDQRIRFEVTYNTRNASRVFPRIVSNTVEELCAVIDQAAIDASERVRLVTHTFTGQTLWPYAEAAQEPHQLILDIAYRLHDESLVQTIVRSLVYEGHVVGLGEPLMRNAIRVLKRAGILLPGRRVGRHYVNDVHSRYRRGLEALQEARSMLHVPRPLADETAPPSEPYSQSGSEFSPSALNSRRFRQRPGFPPEIAD